MNLRNFDYRSPAELIDQVAARVPLIEEAVYVVLVARPPTEQRIVTIRRLATPARIEDWEDASEEICELMEELPIPGRQHPPDHSAFTVIVRSGLCVFGPTEGLWLSAWKYSNHMTNAFGGRAMLVTEHGWYDFMTDTAGHSPALR